RRLDAEDVSTCFEDVSTGFEDVSTGFKDVSTGFEDVSTGFTDIKSASEKVSSGEELELSEAQKKRMAQVQEAAQFYTEEDWDTIRSKLEANADLVKEIAGEDIKKLTDEGLKVKYEYLMRSMERFVLIDTEKESRKRTGEELQTESSKNLKSDIREDVSVPKEKDKELKKPEFGTEEDVEAYMEERVDEPSSEEFPTGSIPQGPAPAKIVKWQIIVGNRSLQELILPRLILLMVKAADLEIRMHGDK
ncbi:hypothetical protein Tco_1552845, partial [Tanacetum coccineum]